jgi:hypothetical protein
MNTLAVMGGLGAPEILILIVIIVFLIISPVMWFQERSKRKYWQAKAEDYEKRLLDKK